MMLGYRGDVVENDETRRCRRPAGLRKVVARTEKSLSRAMSGAVSRAMSGAMSRAGLMCVGFFAD